MKTYRVLIMVAALLLLVSPVAVAGEFDWLKDLNTRAVEDIKSFHEKLTERFPTPPVPGSVSVDTVLKQVPHPADAYMLLRLGELSGRPMTRVMEQYRAHKNKGWGALAKSLGIKPGSAQFKALKQGGDFFLGSGAGTSAGKGHGHGKGKGKGRK